MSDSNRDMKKSCYYCRTSIFGCRQCPLNPYGHTENESTYSNMNNPSNGGGTDSESDSHVPPSANLPDTGWPGFNHILSALQSCMGPQNTHVLPDFSPDELANFSLSERSVTPDPSPPVLATASSVDDNTLDAFEADESGNIGTGSISSPISFSHWLDTLEVPLQPEAENTSMGDMPFVPRGRPAMSRFELARLDFRLNAALPSPMPPPSASWPWRSPFVPLHFSTYGRWRANFELWLARYGNLTDPGAPPLSKEKISQLPRVAVTNADVDKCSVCWEDFNLEEIVPRLTCSHMFHEHCIVQWLCLHDTCPKCRYSLGSDSDLQQPDHTAGDIQEDSAADILKGGMTASTHRKH